MFNPLKYLSKQLERIGIKTYLSKVEFTCHLGWSLVSALLGPITSILWISFSIYDELFIDGHINYFNEPREAQVDFWHDIISKVALPLGYLIIIACGAFS